MGIKICPKCGAENADTAKFCVYCRADLGEGVAAQSAPVTPAPAQNAYPAPQGQPAPYAPTETLPQTSTQSESPYGQQSPSGQQNPYQQQPASAAPQGYPPAPYQAPVEPPKKKKKTKLIVGIIVGVVLLCVITVVTIIGVASCSINTLAKADYYEIGGEKIPSVKYVLGEERKVDGFASENTNGNYKQTIGYSVARNQNTEMEKYATYLEENEGFVTLAENDFSKSTAEDYQLGKNASEAGYALVVTIDYDANGYELTIDKFEGNITAYDSPDPVDIGGNGSNGNDTPKPNDTLASDELMSTPYFAFFADGRYHTKIALYSEGGTADGSGNSVSVSVESEIEMWIDGDKYAATADAAGFKIRIILKDGKTYTIMDDYKMMSVTPQETGDEGLTSAFNADSLTYTGTGTDEFLGGSYTYEEFKISTSGSVRYFYNMANGNLMGIRTVDSAGTVSDFEFLVLDDDVPASVFDIPTDYEIVEG